MRIELLIGMASHLVEMAPNPIAIELCIQKIVISQEWNPKHSTSAAPRLEPTHWPKIVPSSYLLLVVRPGAPSSVLAPSSDAPCC